MTRARDLANLVGSGNFSSTTFTATEGQTAFTISHTQGFVQVFMNGLLLDETADYTSNGTAITLTSGASVGDEIEVVAYNTFSVGDALNQAAADTRYVNTAGDSMTGNLGVGGAANGNYAITSHSSGGANLRLENDGEVGFIRLEDDGDLNIWAHGDENISFLTGTGNGTTRMNIDGSGNVTKPNNPWFDVRGSNNSWTNAAAHDNILNIFNTSLYQNTGGGFNSSNSTYTAPVAGRYCFLLNSYTKGGSAGAAGSYLYPRLYKNGSSIHPRSNIMHYNANENYDTATENTILVDLAANDTIQAGYYSNNTSNQYYGAAWQFQMFFVG